MVRRTRTQATPTKNVATKKVAKVSAPTPEKIIAPKNTEEKKVSGKKPLYKLQMKVNAQEHEVETDNLADAIISFAPKAVKTRVLLHIVRYDGKVCQKQVFVRPARMIFNNKRRMEMFIRQLIFKTNV